jgi:hypothetical protein
MSVHKQLSPSRVTMGVDVQEHGLFFGGDCLAAYVPLPDGRSIPVRVGEQEAVAVSALTRPRRNFHHLKRKVMAIVAMVAEFFAQQSRGDDDLLDTIGFFADANRDLRSVVDQQETELSQARKALRGAKTRANKFACLALLGFGLIAIEGHALTLYFLPK